MNILLINGGKEYSMSEGKLNEFLTEIIKNELEALHHNVQVTHIAKGYRVDEEADKIVWADCVIYQMPLWWMGLPWVVKKYIDEVYMSALLCKNDGRTRSDSSKKYGSGGLCHGKKLMISITLNAPKEAFEEKTQFFEGKTIDELYFHFHKTHQFIGFESSIPGLATYDVVKNPNAEQWQQDLKAHLQKYFS